MKRLKSILVFAIFFTFLLPLNAQVLQPVKWDFSHKELGDNKYELHLRAMIDAGWSIYGTDIEPGGPVATGIDFEDADGFRFIGELIEPDAEVKFDPNFNMDLAMISGIATFKQVVEVTSSDKVTVSGELVYMSCDATSCLPPDYIDFSYTLPGRKGPQADKISDVKKQETAALPEDVTEKSEDDDVVVETEQVEKQHEMESVIVEAEEEESSLFWNLIKGFLGGLLALLTPCVFPMIPLTVSYFLRNADNRVRAIRDALFYGLSIVFSYVVLGLAISVFFGADALNMLATSPWFNIFFFALLVFFAASFFGAFELQMPAKWSNKIDSRAEKSGGLLGVFLMGIVFVLVSFSCTGPIVGTILVEAATGGGLYSPAFSMLGFSLALAIPFTLFAIFPTALKSLPKSGGWMNAVKVVLGFIVLAFAMKFLSTADAVAQWGFITRELFLVVWIAIFLLLGLYLIGKIKFAHDSELTYLSVPRLFLAIAVFAFVFYLIPGLWGAPLKTVSSFLPSVTTQSFDLSRGQVSVQDGALNDYYVGKSVKEGPHGLMAFTDYDEGLEAARKAGKPIFLDFTGLGCSNCRSMEASVWSDPNVIQRFRDNFIKISLFVDDRTRLPEEEQFVSSAMGAERTIRRLGQKWSLFQAERFGTNTQPYYVILDHDENIIAPPRAYNTNVSDYIEFMDKGFENFNR